MNYTGLDVSSMFPKFITLLDRQGRDYYDDPTLQACIFGITDRSAQADNYLAEILNDNPGYLYENNQLVSCPYPRHWNQTGAPCYPYPVDLPTSGGLSLHLSLFGERRCIVMLIVCD